MAVVRQPPRACAGEVEPAGEDADDHLRRSLQDQVRVLLGGSGAVGAERAGFGCLRALAVLGDEVVQLRVAGVVEPLLDAPGGGHHRGRQPRVRRDQHERPAAALLADPVTFLPPPALRAPAPCGRPDPPCGRPDPPCGRPEPPCVLAAGRPAGRLPSEPVVPWSVPRSSIRSILLGRSAPTRAQRQFPPAGDPQILTALPASTEPTRRPAQTGSPVEGVWTSRAAVPRR